MIARIFEEQVRSNPDKIAIQDKDHFLTYSDLNNWTNWVGKIILEKFEEENIPSLASQRVISSKQDKNNKNNQNIALLFNHSNDMIVGILGAIKSAKTYIPLDPNFPIKRLEYLVNHSDIKLIITNNENRDLADKLVKMDTNDTLIINISNRNIKSHVDSPKIQVDGKEIAYIMYTSGSTGTPRGVLQTYKNILYFIQRYTENLKISKDDRMTLFSYYTHDASVMDIYSALLNGATLFLCDIKKSGDFKKLCDFLENQGITIWHSVPTFYRYFIRSINSSQTFNQIRFIVFGGETVLNTDIQNAEKIFPKSDIYNLYGQTESSYNAGKFFKTGETLDKVTIGKNIEGTDIFIVNEYGEEVNPLQVGELLVASPYLSPGYWRDPDNTKRCFSEDPELGRLYWTGDLGRILLDGRVEIVGRKDFMVKIRGFRVEPSEIENYLLRYEDIKEAVVVGSDGTGYHQDINKPDTYLAAYFTGEKKIDTSSLNNYLRDNLPDYMIPSYLIQMEKMPLTPSGKIDKKALIKIKMTIENIQEIPDAPTTIFEKRIVEIISEILEIETNKLSTTANFFEIGGNSLKALLIISKINKTFNTEVTLQMFFEHPTVKEIAERISQQSEHQYDNINPIEKKEYYQLSFNQKRLSYSFQLEPDSISLNITHAVIFDHPVEEKILRKTINKMIERHESLRTGFKEIDGYFYQVIRENVEIPLEIFDLTHLSTGEKEKKKKNILAEILNVPFRLHDFPFFKCILIKSETVKHEFFFNIFHMISDAWSLEILEKEFLNIYESYKKGKAPALEPQAIQYKDFTEWQHIKYHDSLRDENSYIYWRNKIEQGFPELKLPVDLTSTEKKDRHGRGYRCMLDEPLKNKLNKKAEENNTTLFMVLFAAFNVLLSQLTGQKDIVTSIISAGRESNLLQNVVGFFINSILIKFQVDSEDNFIELLQKVNEEVLETIHHQSYPIEHIFEELKIRYPEIAVSINLLNIDPETVETEIQHFEPTSYDIERNIHFERKIEIYIKEFKNGIMLEWIYRRSLFRTSMIERIVQAFIRLLNLVVEEN